MFDHLPLLRCTFVADGRTPFDADTACSAWDSRTLCGRCLSVGGSIPVVFSYFCEFLPPQVRGKYMVLLASFWMVGGILASALAWAIFSSDALGGEMWRVYLGVCGVPSVVAMGLMCLSHESPVWLFKRRRGRAALAVMRAVDECNGRFARLDDTVQLCDDAAEEDGVFVPQPASSYASDSPVETERPGNPLRAERLASDGLSDRRDPVHDSGTSDSLYTESHTAAANGEDSDESPLMHTPAIDRRCRWRLYVEPYLVLFRREHLRKTLTLLVLWFGLSFGYYGLTLWIPTYFEQTTKGIDVYLSTFLVNVAQLPGNLIGAWTIDIIGTRLMLASVMIVGGLCVFLLLVINTAAEVVAMMCLFSGVTVNGWNALDICSTELFPTTARSSAFGMFTAAARIAAIAGITVFGYFDPSAPATPLIVITVFLAGGGLFGLVFLPKTRPTQLS